jgi:hypothetical protein
MSVQRHSVARVLRVAAGRAEALLLLLLLLLANRVAKGVQLQCAYRVLGIDAS